ncbi:MAG: phosphodiesterase [Rhodobacteraceae bacterium]|nr:MAG: phosphodiesterase [Paracoccaceae bacterium]
MTLPAAFLDRPIAHRALHDASDGRPENSRAAIRAAMARGYGIEIDIQRSADGRAMVFHDYMLDRLTAARGCIFDQSAAALGGIALTGGDEGIPTLDEVLALVAGQVPLLIEVKDQEGQMGPGKGTLARAVASALEGYAGPVALMSFNPHAVADMGALAPAWPRGLTTSGFEAEHWPELTEQTRDRLRPIPDADRVGACFISHDARDLAAPRVAELKHAGLSILCWTIRSPEAEAAARRIADNVTFEGYLP